MEENTEQKEKRLVLNDIIRHLPYKLPVEILNYKCDYVGVQYSNLNGYYLINDEPHFTYDKGSTGKSFNDFKPAFRSLKDLLENNRDKSEELTEEDSIYYDLCDLLTVTSCENFLQAIIKKQYYAVSYRIIPKVEQFLLERFFWLGDYSYFERGLILNLNTIPKELWTTNKK